MHCYFPCSACFYLKVNVANSPTQAEVISLSCQLHVLVFSVITATSLFFFPVHLVRCSRDIFERICR